jgi:hypothetical protein
VEGIGITEEQLKALVQMYHAQVGVSLVLQARRRPKNAQLDSSSDDRLKAALDRLKGSVQRFNSVFGVQPTADLPIEDICGTVFTGTIDGIYSVG